MKSLRILKLEAIIFLVSTYFSFLIYTCTKCTFMQSILIYGYFVFIINVIYHLLRKYKPDCEKHEKNRNLCISILFTTVICCMLGTSIIPSTYGDQTVSVKALNEKNNDSQSTEVWITNIEVNGQYYDMSSVTCTGGWSYDKDNNSLLYVPSQPETIQFNIENAHNLVIYFKMHSWSGKINVETDNQNEDIDLYSEEDSTYYYEKTFKGTQGTFISLVNFAGFCIFVIYALYNLLVYSKKSYLIQSISYTVICGIPAVISNSVFQQVNSKTLYIILVLICAFLFYSYKSRYCDNTWKKCLFGFITLIISFMIFGQRLFILNKDEVLIKRIVTFIFMSISLIPLENGILALFEKSFVLMERNIAAKNNRKSFKKYIILGIFALCFSYFIVRSVNLLFPKEYKETVIKIQSSEQKNPVSEGNEILVGQILVNGDIYVPPEYDSLPQGWKNSGTIIGTGNEPLILSFPKSRDIKIVFYKHQWSGIVEIYDGDAVITKDLYSNNGSCDYVYTYEVVSNKVFSHSLLTYFVSVCAFLILGVFIFYLFKRFCGYWNSNTLDRRFLLSVILVQASLFAVFLIASFPASICVDGMNQINQAKGVIPLTDAHPAILTIIIKLELLLVDSPIILAVTNAAFYCFVFAIFVKTTMKNKLNNKVYIVWTILYPLIINNGIYSTTLWKDVPYSLCLLWLTVLCFDISNNKNQLNKLSNVIMMSLCLAGIYLFRHNGLVTFAVMLIFLIIKAIRNRKITYVAPVILSVIIIFAIKGPVYRIFGVQELELSDNSATTAAPFHGLVHAALKSDNTPDSTKKLLTDIMPLELWEEVYNPYSANEIYLSNVSVEHNALEKIGSYSVVKVMKEYIRTLFATPWLLIEDRLTGVDLIWNVFRSDGYDWRVSNDSYEIGVVTNSNNIYRSDNYFTKLVNFIAHCTINNRLFDAVFWRAGFSLIIIFLLFFYCIACMKGKSIIMFIPVMSNIVSLLLSMSWQDFRYVYFINLIMPFLVIMTIINQSSNIEKDQTERLAIIQDKLAE